MEMDVDGASPEGDVCRVCRLESEPDNPLQHPCKCSGSIRYVHSECLTQWLGHSHKKSCELCGHTFAFKKIYPANMPKSLPIHTLLRRLLLRAAHILGLTLRGLTVAVVWLAVLPWVIIAIWRGLFSAGTHAAWYLSGRTYAEAVEVLGPNTTVLLPDGEDLPDIDPSNVTYAQFAALTVEVIQEIREMWEWPDVSWVVDPSRWTWPESLSSVSHFLASDLAASIFKGQLLTVAVLVIGLAIFLLREWIVQTLPQIEAIRAAPTVPEPQLQDWQPDMAVRWRRVRVERAGAAARAAPRPAGGLGPRPMLNAAPIDAQQIRNELQRMDLPGAGERRRRNWRQRAERAVLPDAVRDALPPLEDGAGPEDAEWVDESDDNAGPLPDHDTIAQAVADLETRIADLEAARAVAQNRLEAAPSGSDSDDVLAARPNAEKMREARNRYFTVADHNRDFAALADVTAGESSTSLAGRQNGMVEENAVAGPSDGKLERPRSLQSAVAGSNLAPEPAPFQPRRSARLIKAKEAAAADEPILPGPWGLRAGETVAVHTGLPSLPDGEVDGAGDDDSSGGSGDPNPRVTSDWSQLVAVDEIERAELMDRFPPAVHVPQPRIAMDPPAQEEVAGGEIARPEQVAEVVEVIEEEDPAEEVENGPELDEEGEEFLDEGGMFMEGDLEAVLEAVGFLGPPWVILQNVGIVLTLLSCCLTVFIELPYFFGKLQLLSDTNFPIRLIRLPIWFVRTATDPIIDIVVELGRDVVYRPLALVIKTALAARRVPEEAAEQSVSVGEMVSSYLGYEVGVQSPMVRLQDWAQHAETAVTRLRPPTWLRSQHAEMAFARLGQAAQAGWQWARNEVWRRFAVDTVKTRVVSIALGYTDILASLLIIVALGEAHLGGFGAAVTEGLAHQLIVVKLGFFMGIELAIFPLIMGGFLDLCSLPLFETASIHSRWALSVRHPILSFFTHWLLGTVFMFAFARCLTICRSICRKGAMYSVRDPQDPSFSPVRDILEKRSSTHMWKLTISLTMYLSVLAGPLGCMLLLLRVQPFAPGLLPLRWHIGAALSEVPVDYLYLLLLGPHDFGRLNLEKHFTSGLNRYWHLAARALRLSSYMRGIQYPQQEQPDLLERLLLPVVRRTEQVLLTLRLRKTKFDVFPGGYARVPYADQVALAKGHKSVFIAVDEHGVPLTDELKMAVLAQVQAAKDKKREHHKDYCLVYLPPLYTLRFWLFGIGLWTAIAWTAAAALLVPLAVGRLTLSAMMNGPVHDAYSLIAGLHVCHTVYRVSRRARKRVVSLVRGVTEAARYREPNPARQQLAEVAARLIVMMRYGYSIFIAGGIIPIAIGLIVDLYVVIPLRYGSSAMTPVFYVWEAWALGCLSMYLVYARRETRRAMVNMLAQGQQPLGAFRFRTAMQAKVVNQRLLWPLSRAFLPLIFAPGLVALAASVVFGLSQRATELTFRFIYPSILCIALDHVALRAIWRRWRGWSKRTLEREYLIEKRVLDYSAASAEAAAGNETVWVDVEGDVVDGPGVEEE